MDIENDEDEELICARTFNVHKECVVNDNITFRLEEIEHLYEDFAWMHIIAKEDYYDYEWVIKIYVKGIDPFIYQSTNRIQSRFNFPQEICRLKRYNRTMKMGHQRYRYRGMQSRPKYREIIKKKSNFESLTF